MKKQLNSNAIVSELSNHSVFFNDTKVNSAESLASDGRSPVRTSNNTQDNKDTTQQARTIVRHSFNFYVDQVEALRSLGAQSMFQGKATNLSEFVREAIDDYLLRKQQSAERAQNGISDDLGT